MNRRVLRRWPAALLLLAALALAAVPLAAVLLRDARIRLTSLVELDPPAAPVEIEMAGHRLSVTPLQPLAQLERVGPPILRHLPGLGLQRHRGALLVEPDQSFE